MTPSVRACGRRSGRRPTSRRRGRRSGRRRRPAKGNPLRRGNPFQGEIPYEGESDNYKGKSLIQGNLLQGYEGKSIAKGNPEDLVGEGGLRKTRDRHKSI